VDSPYKYPPAGSPQRPSLAFAPAADEAAKAFRKLIPYPGVDVVPEPMTALWPGTTPPAAAAALSSVSSAPGEIGASIVSQAASVLDEEMAKGVLDARQTGAAARYRGGDPSSPWLRQLHDLVDNVAALWPGPAALPGFPSAPGQAPTGASSSPRDLRPSAPVHPGDRAVIQMTLSNRENRPVRLVPVATDLLSSTGGRIAERHLRCTPGEISLAPGEQKGLDVAVSVPVDAAVGCYWGLLVVTGVDYLRAVIAVDVI
jgi:hypothetical protein